MGRFTHALSREQLLGPNPDPALIHEPSNEKHISSETTPSFIWYTFEDQAVPVENRLLFAEALLRAGVPFSLHIYEKGLHGIGLGDREPFTNAHPWTQELLYWLHTRGLLPPR